MLSSLDANGINRDEREGAGRVDSRTRPRWNSPNTYTGVRRTLTALDGLTEPHQGLGRYLNQIAPLGKDRAQAESKGIRIMTMVGAKGLTVQATIVMALEDGVVPRPDCELGEERRSVCRDDPSKEVSIRKLGAQT